jgi:putative flippase GtrA
MIGKILTSEVFIEFVVFGSLAAARTLIIDIIGWRWLVSWMEKRPWSWEYIQRIRLNVYSYSHGLTFIVSSVTSYFLNRFITFNQPIVDNETRVFVEFMSVSIFTLVLSVIIINILTSNKLILSLVDKIPIVKNYWPMTAKLITIGIVMVINFSGYKLFVFD